jgi:hypothetical protein
VSPHHPLDPSATPRVRKVPLVRRRVVVLLPASSRFDQEVAGTRPTIYRTTPSRHNLRQPRHDGVFVFFLPNDVTFAAESDPSRPSFGVAHAGDFGVFNRSDSPRQTFEMKQLEAWDLDRAAIGPTVLRQRSTEPRAPPGVRFDHKSCNATPIAKGGPANGVASRGCALAIPAPTLDDELRDSRDRGVFAPNLCPVSRPRERDGFWFERFKSVALSPCSA